MIQKSHGFTIVELLIVIVVIAILAALSYVGYTSISNRAAISVLQSDLSQAAKQLDLAKVESGTYQGTDGATTDGSPLQKSDGTTFQYTRSNNGQAFCITATTTKANIPAYTISSDNKTPREGTCPGHTGPSTGGGGGGTIANNSPIQDITQSQCQALPTFTGSNTDAIRTVTDNRGGTTQTYRIAKLADNKCWMLDNLKLGSTSGSITLTPSDSNVSSNFTLPQLTTGGGYEYDNPRAYGPVPGDSAYGYLYNWSAATAGATRTTNPAGSGNATNSICPAGWRLPSGGSTSSDFGQLDQAFGGTGNAVWSGQPNIAHWQPNAAFRGAFAGYWGGSFYDQGSSGLWWSSSAYPSNADLAFFAYVDPGFVGPGDDGYYRHYGYGVRCLLN